MNRRKREIRVTASGALVDVATERWWLASMTLPRATVRRLSTVDPLCVAVAAESRERAA